MVQPVSHYRSASSPTIQEPALHRSLSQLFPKMSSLDAVSDIKHRKTSSFTNLTKLEVPWNKLHRIRNPLLAEILEDIKRSLNYRNRPINEINALAAHCLWTAQNDPASREYLGFICFLCEYGYQELFKAFNEPDKTIRDVAVRFAFRKALYELLKPIIELESNHKKVNLQDPEKVSITLIPRFIAKAIISGPGICNVGILSKIKENFNGGLPFHKHIQFVLSSLENQPCLRSKVRLIDKPCSPDAPTNDMIRMTVGLDDHADVTAWDAQVTALSALLTDLRQGRVGSCFATFLAILQLNSNLSKCLDDFRELISSGSLSKKMHDGRTNHYPALIEVGCHFRDKVFLVTKEAKLENDAYLWESPGLLEACRYSAIAEPKKTLLRTLQNLYRHVSETSYLALSPYVLLKEALSREIPYRDTYLLKKGLLAFESQTNHLLLRIWETAIANMAESDSTGYTSHLMIEAVMKSLMLISSKEKDFHKEFEEKLKERTKFLYDTSLKQRLILGNEDGYYGTFTLFDTQKNGDPTHWIKINTSDLFVEFVKDITQSCSQLKSDVKNKLRLLISSPAFILDVVANFRANFSDNDVSNPWMNAIGNDPMVVYKNYHEGKVLPLKLVIEMHHAEDLLYKIIEMMRRNSLKLQPHLYSETFFNIPLFINELHCCRADLRSPFLLAAMNDWRPPEVWASKTIYDACKEISEKTVTVEGYEALNAFLCEAIKIPAGLNVMDFRDAALKNKQGLDPVRLDWFIFHHILTVEERQKILFYAIPFIDSNWDDSGYHIHMGFIVNPGTGKIELWKIRSDGKAAVPIDQKPWVKDQNYTFILG